MENRLLEQPLNEQFCELVNPIWDGESEMTFEEAKLKCPKCQRSFALNKLRDMCKIGIFLTNTFVMFDEAAGKVRKKWLQEFDQALGVKHRLLEYWYT